MRRRQPFSLAVGVLADRQGRRRMAEGAEEEGGQGAVGAVRAFYLCPSSFNLRLRSMKSTNFCLRQTNLAFHRSIPHTTSLNSHSENTHSVSVTVYSTVTAGATRAAITRRIVASS